MALSKERLAEIRAMLSTPDSSGYQNYELAIVQLLAARSDLAAKGAVLAAEVAALRADAKLGKAAKELAKLGHWWELTMLNDRFSFVGSDWAMCEGDTLANILRQIGLLDEEVGDAE